MNGLIHAHNKDPLGNMLKDYYAGEHEVRLVVESDTLEMSTMRGETLFREFDQMDELEHLALSLCEERVLDVGAGSGCHSLVLQGAGREVDAIDISPGCVEIMRSRGVRNPLHQNLFGLQGVRYRTILMMMNGLGVCGSLDGLNLFMQQLGDILEPGGQVIADSTDLTGAYEDLGEDADCDDSYCGETEFIMIYKGLRSDPFNWVYVDFNMLETIAEYNGYQCEKLMDGHLGHYLARLFK